MCQLNNEFKVKALKILILQKQIRLLISKEKL